MHYRALEESKIQALKQAKGTFDKKMTIPRDACVELQWWSNNALNLEKNSLIPNPEFVLATDASTLGWGAVFGNCSTNGTWSSHEANLHINVLELKAVLYGLKSLVHVTNTHIKVLSDNTIAVCTINRMGTCHSNPCNAVVHLIWQWAISKIIWLSATHIPGVENILMYHIWISGTLDSWRQKLEYN